MVLTPPPSKKIVYKSKNFGENFIKLKNFLEISWMEETLKNRCLAFFTTVNQAKFFIFSQYLSKI
jgi:hypothetical protein